MFGNYKQFLCLSFNPHSITTFVCNNAYTLGKSIPLDCIYKGCYRSLCQQLTLTENYIHITVAFMLKLDQNWHKTKSCICSLYTFDISNPIGIMLWESTKSMNYK